jgi:serine/threonine protein kinase
MNLPDGLNDDDLFTLLLERYSDILKAGGEVDPAADPSLSAALCQRLQRALDCLQRLQRLRPRSPLDSASTVVMDGDRTLHDGLLGRRLGRFQLRRSLGRGGGGIIFLAFDPDLKRDVAVKVPHLEALLTPQTRRRFLREARAAAALDHPNLVPVHEVGESGGVCFLVSAYCPGGSLADWLAAQQTPAPIRLAAQTLAALADAVHYVHGQGIIHRDIKPGNILLDARSDPSGGAVFVPRLTDFGLAKLREAQSSEATHSGAVLGTVSYMAPEQAEGRLRDIGPGTDVYGLGTVLYEMLTGRPPFRGDSKTQTLRGVLMDEPTPPRRLRPEVPRDLETICLKCLHKEPARRYGSAAALADDLRRFLNDEPIRARPLSRIERLRKWVRGRPTMTVLVALSFLLVGVLLVGWLKLASLGQAHDASQASAARQREQRQKILRQKERHLRQYRYADDIALAGRHWDNRRLDELVEHLKGHRLPHGTDDPDDPRSFEWYYLSPGRYSAVPDATHRALVMRGLLSRWSDVCHRPSGRCHSVMGPGHRAAAARPDWTPLARLRPGLFQGWQVPGFRRRPSRGSPQRGRAPPLGCGHLAITASLYGSAGRGGFPGLLPGWPCPGCRPHG